MIDVTERQSNTRVLVDVPKYHDFLKINDDKFSKLSINIYKANQSTSYSVHADTHTTHVEWSQAFHIARYKINITGLVNRRQSNENKIYCHSE